MYIVKDYIYKSTLSTLYNFSPLWIRSAGAPDLCVKNPYNKNTEAHLFYRPRIESLALQKIVAYSHIVHIRATRSPRADGVDATISRAESESITPLYLPYRNLDGLIFDMRDSVKKQHLYVDNKKLDLTDWQPTSDDLLTFVRTTRTNYLDMLKTYRDQPGAGFAFLILREKADLVAEEVLQQLSCVAHSGV